MVVRSPMEFGTNEGCAKAIVWKKSVLPQRSVDEKMQFLVRIIKDDDDVLFIHWLDTCNDINMRDSWGNTVLHWAATLGNMNALAYLISDCGADVNAKNNNGASPLHCAAICGFSEIIDLLLRGGARAMATNNRNQTMFDLLRLMRWEDVLYQYEHLESGSEFDSQNDFELSIDVSFSDAELLGSIRVPCITNEAYSESNPTHMNFEKSIHDKSYHHVEIRENYGDTIDNNPETNLVCMQFQAEMELLFANELAERNEVIRHYTTWMMHVINMVQQDNINGHGVHKSRHTEILLAGEKCSPRGTHQLPVRMVGSTDGNELSANTKNASHCGVANAHFHPLGRAINPSKPLPSPVGKCRFNNGSQSERGGLQNLTTLSKLPLNEKVDALPTLPQTKASEVCEPFLPPLRTSTSLLPLLRQPSVPPLSKPKVAQPPLLSPPLLGEPVIHSSKRSSDERAPYGGVLNTLRYPKNNEVGSATRGSTESNGTIESTEKTLPHIKPMMFERGPDAPARERRHVTSTDSVPSSKKLPTLRQYLSSEEKKAYDSFLKESAMLYLKSRLMVKKL